MLPFRVRVEWGALAMKGYSSYLTIWLFSVISRTLVSGGHNRLQRCSRCILQPQPQTGQDGSKYSLSNSTSLYTHIISSNYRCLIITMWTKLYSIRYSYLIKMICTSLYSLKYSNQILMIYTQSYGFKLTFLFTNKDLLANTYKVRLNENNDIS